jgi:uncharacterized protein (TIGR02271 family)
MGTEYNGLPADADDAETRTIPVIEERLLTGTRRIDTGAVRIEKHVTREEVSVDAATSSEEVVVERKEINQYVDVAPPAVRQEGDMTIISVVKEVLVVEKRLMLVEELHITKRLQNDVQTISEVLRKEEVTVTRTTPGMDIS